MYQAVDAILEKNGADLGAAEAHGMAVGMLCVEIQADAANWLQELFADDRNAFDEDIDLLTALFERSRALLSPEEEAFEFDLLLPGEDEALGEQVEALRCWCQGFLFGVGYSGAAADWPGDCGEVMQDMVELTKLDSHADGEEDENALMEIREYVRAAVLTVRDQFAENAESARQLH